MMGYRRPTIQIVGRQKATIQGVSTNNQSWPMKPLLMPHLQFFEIARPLSTHFEETTCKVANCPAYLNGWRMVVPTTSIQAEYIRHESGRYFTEERREGGMSEFSFPPGQVCFAQEEHRPHRRLLDKQELFTHRTTSEERLHERSEDWVEHANEEAYKTNRMIERG